MKAELTTLAGQRETTCHERKERVDTALIFFFWFSVVVRVYLFDGFIFTGLRLLFAAHPKVVAGIFVHPYISVDGVQTSLPF